MEDQASQFLSCTRQCKRQPLLLLVVIYTCVLCMEMRCLVINLMGSWGDAPLINSLPGGWEGTGHGQLLFFPQAAAALHFLLFL
jgi:hypothetical protein